MGLIRKTLAVGKFAIGVPPGVGPKFFSNGEAIRRQANKQTRLLQQMAESSQPQQYIETSQPTSYRQERACPECAESILAEAKLCRFCHSSVTPLTTERTEPQTVIEHFAPIATMSCANCGTKIAKTAKICKGCRIDL